MKKLRSFLILSLTLLAQDLWAQTPGPAPALASETWKSLEDFWGAAGWQENGVEVLGFPRSDLNVMVEGVPLENAMGLTSRLRFKSLSKGLAVKGQLVLLDQESRRVQNRLILDGFKLENFGGLLVGETPGVKLLEFSGKGTQSILDAQLKEVLKLTGTPLTPLSFPTPAPGASQGWASLQEALGEKGFVQGKVLWILAPAFTPVSDPALGYFSLRFQRDGQSLLVLGEAGLTPAKVQTLLKLLAREKMTVTALAPGAGAAATRVRWWGTGAESDLVPAAQKIIALAGQDSSGAPEDGTPTPTGPDAPEGGF